MVTRAELRNLFAEAIEDAALGLNVFVGKHIDALHDVLPAVIVAFDTVAVEQDLSDNFRFTGDMATMILINGDDDALDKYIDGVIISVMAAMRSQLPGTGCQLSSLEYVRDVDPGVAVCSLSWEVVFNG